jgi:hypothetical protein
VGPALWPGAPVESSNWHPGKPFLGHLFWGVDQQHPGISAMIDTRGSDRRPAGTSSVALDDFGKCRVVVTRLDHDANVTPWAIAAAAAGATLANEQFGELTGWIDFNCRETDLGLDQSGKLVAKAASICMKLRQDRKEA